MSIHIIIPARYGSKRFPGKPLAKVAGIPMLQRVWALGVSVAGVYNVTVATDDTRIAEFCSSIGADCVVTEESITNGTARAHFALEQLPRDVDHIINLQGDAVLTPPWVIKAIVETMNEDPSIEMATPAVHMSKKAYEHLLESKAAGEVGGTTVVFDNNSDALYFSKSVIPYVRSGAENPTVYRHIGLYGYRSEALAKLIAFPAGVLEKAEQLEQLRALENGMKIRVVVVDYKGRSHTGVDSEADLRRAEKLISTEGELLPIYDGSYVYKS